MQSSDQQSAEQPADETSKQGTGTNETEIDTEEQPLYEFPSSDLLRAEKAPAERAMSTQPQREPESALSDVASSAGFVYPPPPSFYQNMPAFPQNPQHLPFPPNGSRQSAPPVRNFSSTAQSPLRPGNFPPAVPPPGAPQPTQASTTSKSNKWVWIVVSILSIAVIGSCGLCGWGIYTIFASTVQQVSGSLDVVNDYYTNLQSKNYTAAYSDLAPRGQISGLTQDQFVKQARQLDQQYGPINSFVLAQPHFRADTNTGPDLSHFTITVDVKRSHSSYTTLLSVDKIGSNWKITEYDRI